MQGQPNADGVSIVSFTPPLLYALGGYNTLAVENDELVARKSNGQKIRGAQLVGSTILVQVQTGLVLPVLIGAYEEVESWADGGAPVAAYRMVYTDVNSALIKNVCSGSLLDVATAAVTVLGNETYDNATKTAQPNPGWITLACAGSAAAKMRLMGYGPQTNFDGGSAPSSVSQRTATLKMITAAYCPGSGQSYTATGTPVVWQNHAGSVDSSIWHTPGDVEAVWNANGAVCLGAPRIAGTTAACSLPTCDDYDVGDGEWITYAVE